MPHQEKPPAARGYFLAAVSRKMRPRIAITNQSLKQVLREDSNGAYRYRRHRLHGVDALRGV